MAAIEGRDPYFVQKPDALGKVGLSALQKATAAIHQLAYSTPADAIDEYVRIGEIMVLKSLKHFCAAVNDVFEDEYLRHPTAEDVERLLVVGTFRGC